MDLSSAHGCLQAACYTSVISLGAFPNPEHAAGRTGTLRLETLRVDPGGNQDESPAPGRSTTSPYGFGRGPGLLSFHPHGVSSASDRPLWPYAEDEESLRGGGARWIDTTSPTIVPPIGLSWDAHHLTAMAPGRRGDPQSGVRSGFSTKRARARQRRATDMKRQINCLAAAVVVVVLSAGCA